jgi:hypothetical protein
VPLTYLSHQAPVVGLKLARPRWFDGTALVIGSMSPDFAYALWREDPAVDAHLLPALVWFCVPATVVVCWVIRWRVAAVAFAHVPDLGPLHLRDYRVLARRRPRLVLTATSALVGAVTHTVWDGFTHGDRFGPDRYPWLHDRISVLGYHEYRHQFVQQLSTVVGALVTLLLLWVVARRRLLHAWYGTAVDELGPGHLERRQRVVFWIVAAVGLAVGVATALASDYYWVITLRITLGLAAGVALASALPATHPRDEPAEVPASTAAPGQRLTEPQHVRVRRQSRRRPTTDA